ncbi:MAG: hypothetical protein Q8O46_01710 [bacterium]|nr:hypothetical protein [bacterium]
MKRVGILRGGAGENYETSLREGGDLISYISENLSPKWKPVDILIDRNGIWHMGGMPVQPADLARKVDVVWNMSHPHFSNILESFSMRTLGIPPFSSFLGGSREMLREHMKKIGVNLPRHMILPAYQPDFDGPLDRYIIRKAKEVHQKFGAPWVVKSLTSKVEVAKSTEGGSPNQQGWFRAKTFPELISAIDDGFSQGVSVSVEELILGEKAEVHSIGGFRGEDLYTVVVHSMTSEEKEKLTYLSSELFKHVGAKSYMNSHFILHPKRGVFLVGLEFLPDLKEDSYFHQSCDLIGAKVHHIIEHMLERAK